MTRIRRFAHITLGIMTGTSGTWEKYSRARVAFSPSRAKSSSCGRESCISSLSHVRSYSGNQRFNVEKVKLVNARSSFAHSSSAGCCTLTATFCPVSRTVARCTCARDAAPMGASSNSEKKSEISRPVSRRTISWMDS